MPSARILTFDPSFRHFGWAAMDIHTKSEEVIATGVIVTKKADKKLKRYAGDDDHRCCRIITEQLIHVIAEWEPLLICAESLSPPRSQRAAMLMGMGWAILSAVSFINEVPVLQMQVQDIKEANAGSRKASKEEIRKAVCERYPEAANRVSHINPDGLHEHAYDAIAAAVACLDSTEIATLRRIAS